MAKKEIFYQGLDAIPVIIEDTSLTSPDYFRVTSLPTQLNAGTNIFKFKGNISLFPEGADVYVEILDANGMPVYYEVGIDLESQDQPAVVTIFINEDTTPGNGSIIICSTLTQSIEGQILDPSEINLRWQVPIYIDVSKRNDAEIIFNTTPTVTVTSNYSQVSEINYRDLTSGLSIATLRTNAQVQTAWMKYGTGNTATYYYNNDTPMLVLNNDKSPFVGNDPRRGFITSSLSAVINISSSYFVDLYPATSSTNVILQQASSSVVGFTGSVIFPTQPGISTAGTGSHIAVLKEPISFLINNSNDRYYPKTATISYFHITYTLSKTPDNVYTFENKTQNTYNSVTVNFSNLTPLVGTIAKIRSYYKSSGVGEYILLNETDITQYDTEFGFNTGSLSATYALPTVHKGEKIDFKFEYISPTGFVSKQYTEVKDTTFVGGNSYIAGEDNLITGSLFVASSTGSGVQISGRNNAAAIRSLGYEGFEKASLPGGRGGFVIYSGSVQPILNASENYSGVGIELFANTSSYFKYTTSGSGLLDIRTNTFFLGNPSSSFISGSNGNLQISSSNFALSAAGNITGSNMLLSGTTYAEFFANKQIVIDSSNSGSYFKYYDADGYTVMCVLNLAGVSGPMMSGSAAMYIRFFVNPKVPIAGIITPTDSGYDGQIIIETYGPAYSSGTAGVSCGQGIFGADVLLLSNQSYFGEEFYSETSKVNYGVSGSALTLGGNFLSTTYFTDGTATTPPPGLPGLTTLGAKRSARAGITFEVDDWASKSYNKTFQVPSTLPVNSMPKPPDELLCLISPYDNMLQASAGGRYAFAPGDSGWRLQSVTNYSGSVVPLMPNGIVLKAANGGYWKVNISNAGNLTTTSL
jgi:hypothetical protein